MWKRKNVTLTGHGAMARLDRTVRTLRWYMFLIWLYKGGELTNWYKLFSLAVRHFNTVPHQFSLLSHQSTLSDTLTQCTV